MDVVEMTAEVAPKRIHGGGPRFTKENSADMTRKATAARHAKTPLRLIGNGPWRLLPECPATIHNTLRAARGQDFRSGERCICPRALALFEVHRQQQARRRRQKAMGLDVNGNAGEGQPVISRNVNYVASMLGEVPNLRGSACTTDAGREIMDNAYGAIAETDNRVLADITSAKLICVGCSVLAECGGWVLGSEVEPGEWGGVYGGLSIADRVRMRAERTA